jgi:hypothetical protein
MARKNRETMLLEQPQAADAQGYKCDGLKHFNPNESNLEMQKVILLKNPILQQKQPHAFLKYAGHRRTIQR